MAKPLKIALSTLLVSTIPLNSSLAEEVCADEVCIEIHKTLLSTKFYASNRHPHLPVTLALALKLENMHIVEGSADPIVLPGGTEKKWLFDITRKEFPPLSIKWGLEFHWVRGDFKAIHNEKVRYAPPYASNKSYKVAQGCNGKFSHTGPARYSIDFQMSVGEAIHAARAGKVVGLEARHNRGGTRSADFDFENKIVLQHADGTFGIYSHLKKNGAAVELGQHVEKGELIGYSGNTGFSSAPHLHFAVAKATADGKQEITLPITFETSRGAMTCPAVDTRMRHAKPAQKDS